MSETENRRKTDKPWQFKKGKSGNPGGRPKISGVFRDMIDAHALRRAAHNKTNLQHLIEWLYANDQKTYLSHLVGRPVESHEFNGSVTLNGMPEDLVRAIQQRAAERARLMDSASQLKTNGSTDHTEQR